MNEKANAMPAIVAPAIIAVDLDDTLLRSDKTVSPRTLAALEAWEERGSRIVVATGRPLRSAERLQPELRRYPWIAYNGALIQEAGQPVYVQFIPPEDARAIVQALQELAPDCRVGVELSDHTLYVNQPLEWPWAHQVSDLLSVMTSPAAKILFSLEAYRQMPELDQILPPSTKVLISEKYNLVQIMPAQASKAVALAFLAQRWGRSLEEAVAFGDDVNDVEMVAESGLGVAMGNAAPEVKAVADRITATNDEDGVALVLEELLDQDGRR